MAAEKLGLPSMEYTFSISITGDETKRHYDGQFTYLRPNLHMKAEIAKMKTRLNGDMKTLAVDVQLFNEMCAALFYCLVQSPDWWQAANNGRDLYDLNVLSSVYAKCMDFEEDWVKRVWGDKKDDVELSKKESKQARG